MSRDRRFQTWLQFGYLPLVGGGAAVAIVALGSSRMSMGWGALIVGAVVGLSYLAERSHPYLAAWNHDHDDRWRDLTHVVVNESVLVASLLALSGIGLTDGRWWPAGAPFWAQVAGSLLVLDAGITLAHVLSHRWGWMWRFHAVHHSVARFYGLNGLMKHPVHQMIEAGAGMAPLLVLGVPHRVASTVTLLVVVQLLMQHSNVDVALGRAGGWLALAPGHRLHHLRYPGQGDVNFGLFTLIWDRLLGTYEAPATRSVGVGDLGVSGRPDFPETYLAQLAEPFRPDR